MKKFNRYFAVLLILLVVFLGLQSIDAQDRNDSVATPGVEAVKYSWSKDRINWETDPFSGPIENFDEMRVRTRNERRIQDARRGPGTIEAGRAERDAATDQALTAALHKVHPARYGFTYKVSLQNKGTQDIVAIDWDYVFYDAINEMELGRKEFGSEQKIGPGKTKEFKFVISSPPARRISVHALNKHERDGMSERIEFVRVQYADGRVWQRPTTP